MYVLTQKYLIINQIGKILNSKQHPYVDYALKFINVYLYIKTYVYIHMHTIYAYMHIHI